jgi:hypothetical protein
MEKTRLMLQQNSDRRSMRRFDMRLPAMVRIAGEGPREVLTETQNVSARGVFFYLDRAVDPGARIEVTLTFPPHITLTDPVRVRFAARVIRVESPLPSSRIGIAAMIEEYEFLRSGPNPEFMAALSFGRQSPVVGRRPVPAPPGSKSDS